MANKILVYSRNGEFLRYFSLPGTEDGSLFGDIDFINSDLFVAQYINVGQAQYNWIIIDTAGNIKAKKENSVPAFKTGMGTRGGICRFGDKFGYWNTFNDTVFSVFPDFSYEASFLFAAGEHRIPRSAESGNPEGWKKWMFPYNLFETDQFLVFRYSYNYSACALIDKKNGKVYLENIDDWETEDKGILNNLDGGTRFIPHKYLKENDREYLIGSLDPLKLKKHIAGEDFKGNKPEYPEKKEALKKLADGMQETGSTILMIVRLKK